MWRKIRFWILERVGQRDEIHTYTGYGDFSTERGWWVGRFWFSYDRP